MSDKEQAKEQPDYRKLLASGGVDDTNMCHKTAFRNATTVAAADEDDDHGLFGPFPPRPECPICFIPLPIDRSDLVYKTCCGKIVCNGCKWESDRVIGETNLKRSIKNEPKLEKCCPFCRAPVPKSNDEILERAQKRMDMNDAEAFCFMGGCFHQGVRVPNDERKAFQCYLRAAELGLTDAMTKTASYYELGIGVPKNEAKAIEYFQAAAKRGSPAAHFMLGLNESLVGNWDLAMKFFRVAAAAGCSLSLDNIKIGYKDGYVSKDEYAKSLRAHQAARDEERSEERERARAAALSKKKELLISVTGSLHSDF